MSVQFLKRLCLSVCAVFITAVVAFSLGGSKDAIYAVKTVYYVVEPTESVAASGGQIALRGGAGYPIAGGVAFGVYFSEKEAEQIRRRLEGEYSEVMLYPVRLSFHSSEDSFAYTVLQIVEEWTKILQNGGGQATVRDGLQSVAGLLSWRGKRDNSTFLLILCGELENCLAKKVLYVDRLRELTCFGCEQLSLKNKMIRI